ncbi:hypothetical protein DSO57_1010301 [Entomophthora muscae]|uniref:Uncharacterized protein n=1 Tax=Entomophthora muscae TaxID=34485 RepID=A0ACC2U4V9_9FUNG|nr:hypothetical protein DSO57_1010301 [Entomophthora muscae]
MSQKKYKTKFPVSRIKKIMQTDEEVGKMTQNTPVLISAAVELFIKSIVSKACREAKMRKSARISLSHLKKCIGSTEQFDFLKDLVAEVPDPSDVPVKKGEASDSDKKCPSPLLPPGTCIGPLPIKNLPYRMKSTPSTISATKLNNYSQPRPSYPPPPGGTAVGFRPPVMAQNFTQQPMTMVQTSSQYSFPLEFVTPQNFQQPNRPQPPIRPFQQTMPQAFQHSTPQSFQQPPQQSFPQPPQPNFQQLPQQSFQPPPLQSFQPPHPVQQSFHPPVQQQVQQPWTYYPGPNGQSGP